MAQNISIAGANYPDVPALSIPKTGGGTAVFSDPSNTTAASRDVRRGKVFLDASGQETVGMADQLYIEPVAYDYLKGYVANNLWNYQDSTNNHSDVYEVVSGHKYYLGLGKTVGTRFRAVVTTTSPVGSTSNITGTKISEKTNPSAMEGITFIAGVTGYLTVTKDNVSVAGLKSFLADITPDD